ncbi:MAG: hypothetical protein ACK501_12425 [Planctomycetota bacterium]
MGFKETLKDAVRQMSFRTSLDSLKKKGVQQVNVLGIDRIIALIEAAVHRSLKSRLVGVEREAVADATKAEFLRLLRSNEDLQREKSAIEQQRERAEEEIDQLRREIAQQSQALQLKLDEDALELANRYDGENAAIARKVSEVVQSFVHTPGVAVSTVEQRLMELVMNVVSGERQAAEEARRALKDREVDNLQRRIKKLNDSLSQTEQRLQQVAAMKSVDGGISSIYREVQGVDLGDQQAGKKKELMADIFKANLKLQKKPGA